MPKVSVIVPVFKVEKYIERCAHCLFGQTLDDVEYIFVNDCTPDESITLLRRVLDDYPARKDQVTIIDCLQNGGQAASRSIGIRKAVGDYIIHCDSDDWVDANLYEAMYDMAIKTNSDVVLCPIQDEYATHFSRRPITTIPSTCREVLEDWYKNSIGMFMWNKLVRRSVIEDNGIIHYEGINMWEDNGFMLRVFYYANGLAQIDSSVYHYNRVNSSAMTNAYGEKAVEQMIRCAELFSDFLISKPDYARFERTVLSLKFFARINLITDSFKGLKRFYITFPESQKIIPYIGLDSFSAKGKIRFLSVRYHLELIFVLSFRCLNIFNALYNGLFRSKNNK